MINLKRPLIITVALLFMLTGCNSSPKSIKSDAPKSDTQSRIIAKYPSTVSYSNLKGHGKLEEFPFFDSSKSLEVDIRSADLTSLDISDKLNELLNATFDSKTKWPENLPKGFNPASVLTLNKNPGLELRKLHAEKITGKNVNTAIIDYPLLVNHIEYKDNLRLYEEINVNDQFAQMHGPAVASILAGKTAGVAPGAKLYFIACENFNRTNKGPDIDFTWEAKAIDRIVEINKTLPKDQKIRVLSMSSGWAPNMKGYKEITDSVKRAVDDGIFVVSCNLFETYKDKFYFHGLSIDNLSNKDDVNSYKVYEWSKWMRLVAHINGFSEYYGQNIDKDMPKEMLLIPIDCVTTASPTDDNDYVFYKAGGWSWIMPYISGLYALCCQVNPDITPKLFWEAALSTGLERPITKGNNKFAGKIINPEKLIQKVKELKAK